MMDRAEILRYFKVDKSSGESLRSQIEKNLENFLSKVPAGTQLPAERELAQTLDVSRVTVRNALEPFFLSGRILRQRRNGTISAPSNIPKVESNELALGLPWQANPPRSLRFLCYETLPQQRIFWEHTVADFNERSSEKVELVWLNSCLKGRALLSYLGNEEIDLLLYSTIYGVSLPELARPLPESLRTVYHSQDYVSELFTDHINDPYRLPLHLAFWTIFWNKNLAKQCGLHRVKEAIAGHSICSLVGEALERLPEDVQAGSHIWCHLAYQGIIPEAPQREKLLEVLHSLAALPDPKRSFMLDQRYSEDDAEKFINGELLFFEGTVAQLQTIPRKPSFVCGEMPFPPAEQCRRMCCSLDAVISHQCRCPDLAEKFLAFLISPEIQQRLLTEKQSIPIVRKIFMQALRDKFNFTGEESLQLLKNSFLFRDLTHAEEAAHYFLIFKVREELRSMMSGTLSPEQCADQIIRRWEIFKKREQIQ